MFNAFKKEYFDMSSFYSVANGSNNDMNGKIIAKGLND